jgi:N-methylhydantoinase A
VDALEASLAERGFAGQFMMMGSNGGVLSRQHAAAVPIVLVESGPVGGCIGAGAYAAELGISNVIAFDMGGTTAKCALVQEGRFETDSIYYVGGYGRGIPVRVGVVDIVEVGTGGGSIASLDAQKRLLVGPKSAGSMPGPVAYGRGGAEPTVTDANLLLGRIGAESFQGGEMKLDLEGARAAMLHWLAEPLGYGEAGLDELASGVLSIATLQMGEAIKRITIQRGLDPANFTLFAYGGGGPLHSVELARQLRIPTVVVPPEAGNFSAIGMLLADIRRDQSATFLRPLDEATLAEMEQVFRTMQDELSAHILADFGELPVSTERAVEIRYVGQFHTVRMDVGEREAKTDLYRRFHETYKARYGHASQTAPAEIVSLHCTLVATTAKPDIAGLAGALPSQAPEPATLARRRIYLASTKDHAESVVYSRRSLPRGFKGSGPAVIEEYGSTTLLSPADTFEIGKLGEIRISVGQQAGPANG